MLGYGDQQVGNAGWGGADHRQRSVALFRDAGRVLVGGAVGQRRATKLVDFRDFGFSCHDGRGFYTKLVTREGLALLKIAAR